MPYERGAAQQGRDEWTGAGRRTGRELQRKDVR